MEAHRFQTDQGIPLEVWALCRFGALEIARLVGLAILAREELFTVFVADDAASTLDCSELVRYSATCATCQGVATIFVWCRLWNKMERDDLHLLVATLSASGDTEKWCAFDYSQTNPTGATGVPIRMYAPASQLVVDAVPDLWACVTENSAPSAFVAYLEEGGWLPVQRNLERTTMA